MHQNWWRSYSPVNGRYVSSDPIGLDGGLNTYAYAAQNPLTNIDPTGRVAVAVPIVIKVCEVTASALIGIMSGIAIYEFAECDGPDCEDGENEEEKKKKNCQALKDSILNTCYGLKGRKRLACFEAANTAYRQCMGYE